MINICCQKIKLSAVLLISHQISVDMTKHGLSIINIQVMVLSLTRIN